MISLSKRTKPDILVSKETQWTNDLMAFVNSSQKIPKHIKGKYRHPDIKKELLEETNKKCAYCESKIPHIDHGDIEHILPKSKEPSKTFLWENLTLGCTICNQNKKEYYNPQLPLLNPYTDKPEEKILFAGPISAAAVGSQSASITIKQLQLNRAELVESRTNYLNNIEPLIRQYEITNDENFRKILLNDIIELTKPDKEYSSMVTYYLALLAITA
jgi:uncharacterized protein (TIGR02646 family)